MSRFLKVALLGCAAVTATLAMPAAAQQVDSNKLLEIMVAKGLVSREEADAMIAQARSAPAPIAGGVAADGTQTIPYVPQVVRDQIKQELRTELAGQAEAQGWIQPGQVAEWTKRISLYGDVRLRGEARFMAKTNGDSFTNYGAINHGDPQNINPDIPNFVPPAFLNTLEDRQRVRLRARLGVKAQIDDWISADIRIATGADNSPVSTNQTLGAETGTGKYHIWLDRAAIRLTPVAGLNVDLGRFANPFWTSDLIYDWDMNFDGVAVSGKGDVGGVSVFGAMGAFPVFNTSLNFGSRNAPEGQGGPFRSQDKYLLAAQAGLDVAASDKINVRLAGAYFHYAGVEAQLSAPCYWDELVCSTDENRPAFQQYGNTMRPIRNIIANPLDLVGSPENQYFGLATPFRIANVRAALDYRASDSFALRFEGDFVKNLGWNRTKLTAHAVNNLGPIIGERPRPNNPEKMDPIYGPYAGGNTGWQTRLTVGSVLNLNWYGDWQAKPGDWNAYIGYRRLESDAVIDAFADSDMHIGGTNNQGWYLGGNYAFGKNTLIGARWLSADEIVDAPFSVDRLFVDVMTRF